MPPQPVKSPSEAPRWPKIALGAAMPPVAGQPKIETSAHAIPLDRGIHRGGEAGNGVHQRLAHLREFNRAGAVSVAISWRSAPAEKNVHCL